MTAAGAVTCHASPLRQVRSDSRGDDLGLNRTKELVHEEVERHSPLENLVEL
jgi:hypothetical protein